jgi:O-antigen/teichoic acid export membrane protein
VTLFGNATRLGAGELGSRIPLIVLELTLARTLGPAIYGLWSVLQTIIMYGNFLHFGVVSSLTRKEPALNQRGEVDTLAALRSATYGFQIAVVVLVLVIVLLAALAFPSMAKGVGGTAVIPVLVVTILLQQIQITAQASAINNFFVGHIARARILFSVAFLGLGILAARQESPLVWLMAAWSGALITSTTMLYIRLPSIRARPRFDPTRSLMLLRDGFPIFVQGLLRLLLSNTDKLMVWKLAHSHALGIYALGTLACGIAAMFSSIVVRVSLPTLLRLRESDPSGPAMVREMTRTLWFALLASFAAACLAGAFAPLFINFILPVYREAYWTTSILSCTGGVIGLGQAAADIAMYFGQKRRVLRATVLTVPALVSMIALAWFATRSTVAVAIVTLPVFGLYAAALLRLCFSIAGLDTDEATRKTGRILLFILGVVMLALGLTWIQTALIETARAGYGSLVIGNVLLISTLLAGARFAFRRLPRF